MSFDTSRLYSTLLSSRIQQDNNALYQVIYQLIGALVDTQKFINSFGGGGTDDVINNQVNNIYQIINRSGEGGSSGKTIPGPKGDTGSAGLNGASLPGPLGIIRHYVESYPRYIPIMGNAGNPGTTGAQGPLSPIITSRFTEIIKQPIQIFQTTGSSSAGALTYLGTQTTAGAAVLDFASLISATYNRYIFYLENVLGVTDNTDLLMRCSTDNGATFDTGNNYWFAQYLNNVGAFSTNTVCSGAASAIKLMPTMDNGTTTGGFNGRVELSNPLNAAQYKSILAHGNAYLNDNQFYNNEMGGGYLSITAVNAVRFLMSSGNIIGTIRMFGVKNS